MTSRRLCKHDRGFTLLEVLVALIFFGLIGIVIQQVSASTVGQYHTVRMKMFGTWVAENKLAEIRLSGTLPPARESKEEVDYAGFSWQVVSKVISTENPDINRVELEVFHIDEETNEKIRRAALTGFAGRY